MATIDIRRPHSLGLETARSRAEELANELATKMGVVWKWEGDSILFHADGGVAKGVKGSVAVSSSQVHVAIDLPLLLRAMKATIAGRVESRVDKFVT